MSKKISLNTPHYKALTDIELNTKNRNQTAQEDGYGPLNPNDDKGSKAFWEDKAKMWNTTVETAKQSTCGNCAAFNQTKSVLDKIAEGLGPEGKTISELANLGFCEIWEFKCAADRTCNVWLVGGPIKESKMEISESSRALASWYLDEKRGLWDNIHAKRERIEKGSGERMRKPGEKGRPTEADFKAAQNEEHIDEAAKSPYFKAAVELRGRAIRADNEDDKTALNWHAEQLRSHDPAEHKHSAERMARHDTYLRDVVSDAVHRNSSKANSLKYHKMSGVKRVAEEIEQLEEGPKDAAGKDVFVKKIAKSAGVGYKAAGAIAAAAGRKRLGKEAFQRRVEAGQKAAAKAREKGEKYTGEHK